MDSSTHCSHGWREGAFTHPFLRGSRPTSHTYSNKIQAYHSAIKTPIGSQTWLPATIKSLEYFK